MDGITTLTLGVAAAALAGAIGATFAQTTMDGPLLAPLPGPTVHQATQQVRERMDLQTTHGLPASAVAKKATSALADEVQAIPAD